jgi:hypothetical protein
MKNPYIETFKGAAGLILLVFLLNWFGSHVTFNFPDPAFKPFIIIWVSAFGLLAVALYYRFDDRNLVRRIFTPDDFRERDEREELLTAKAARRAFATMNLVLIVGAVFAIALSAITKLETLKAMSLTCLFLYVVMHLVFIATLRRFEKIQ